MPTVPLPRRPWRPKVSNESPNTAIPRPDLPADTPAAPHRQIFRAFSKDDFVPTPSWRHLNEVLAGTGGSYGLYGPRGSGKSWLMMRAITKANESHGLGLWFPCPSQYNSTDFLSAISDNLASAVERRFVRKSPLMLALRRGQMLLIALIALIFIFGLVTAVLNDIFAATAHHQTAETISALPSWIFVLFGASIFLLIVIYAATLVRDNTAIGRLVREASSLRERIRFTASLRLGSEAGVSTSKMLASTLTLSREKSLDERPTSVASLIFDFRNLVELIAVTLPGPVVIGIDELDKIEKPKAARKLLREIKGIFEVTGVHFLVSISAEALSALQLGSLHPDGRNEFNSSFYTVIELPPLTPDEARDLLRERGCPASPKLAAGLCLLSGGNQRELVRLADVCMSYHKPTGPELDEAAIITVMDRETSALIAEIVRTMAGDLQPDDARYGAWTALPHEAFSSPKRFIDLSTTAIEHFWEPSWANEAWEKSLQETWRRLLVRLFVAGRLLAPVRNNKSLLEMPAALTDLRDVLLAASSDAGVGKSLLTARFGNSGEYRPGQAAVSSLVTPTPPRPDTAPQTAARPGR